MSAVRDAPAPRHRAARRWRDSRWAGVVGLLAVLVVVAVTSGPATAPAWSVVPLPGDPVAVTLTAYGDELLVGTRSQGETGAPGLVRVQGARRTVLPVQPASGYGAEARWTSMAVDDAGTLVAVGGARGGAHGNVRWSVWRGAVGTGLREEPQTFATFGGWGAGDLVSAVAPASGPVLVGSWESQRTGHDAAVWRPSGPATWARQSSAGTALESTSDELVGVVSAAADGSGVLICGSVVRLEAGSVRELPAVWRSRSGVTGWRRVDLPAGKGGGEARSATCAGGTCTVVGEVDGRLAVWRLTDAAERIDPVPDVPLDPAGELAPPVLGASGVLLAVPDGSGSRLLRKTGGRWTSVPGPPGHVRALAVVGSVAYAVAGDTDPNNRLWTAHL